MGKNCCIGLLFMILGLKSFSQSRGLDYFIKQAITNSPLLNDYRNQRITNSIDSEIIRATRRPQVNGISNNSYAPVIGNYGYDGAITNGANISALVGVNKTLIGKNNLNSQFRSIDLLTSSSQNTAAISKQDLLKSVTAQYITTYGDQQEIQFSDETVALLTKEDTILKKLTEGNVYRQTDYLTFLVTLQQQKISGAQLKIQYENDYYTLNYLCGISDSAGVELPAPDIQLTEVPEPEKSIFFKQYVIDSLKLVNQRTILDFTYKPKVNIFADAGYVTSQLRLPTHNFGTSIGFSLAIPIYDGRQRKMQYRKLNIAEETRTGYKKFFSLQFNQQIRMLNKQLRSTKELLNQIDQQIKYSEGLIRVNSKLLASGDVKVADLIIAMNNYINARSLHVQNTISSLQLINELNYWSR